MLCLLQTAAALRDCSFIRFALWNECNRCWMSAKSLGLTLAAEAAVASMVTVLIVGGTTSSITSHSSSGLMSNSSAMQAGRMDKVAGEVEVATSAEITESGDWYGGVDWKLL